MTPVHIATKPHIKVWLERNLPEGGAVDRNHFIGAFLINMLKRDTDKYCDRVHTYASRMTIYVSVNMRKRQGAWLNVTETRQFNKMVGGMIMKELRGYILTFLHFDPRLNKAVEYARTKTGLDYDALSDDAIIKDFQRYRAEHGGPRLYKNNKPIEY